MMDWIYAHSSSTWLLRPLGQTVVAVGVAYVIGLALRDLVVVRLVRIASRTRGDWDDILVSEVRRRVPLWCLLGGLRLSIAYWNLGEVPTGWATRLLFALAVGSVTLAAAGGVTRLVSSYGTRRETALPITSLTQNLARLVVLSLGFVIILDGFNVEVKGLLTLLGVGGLTVALALQEPLSNLFAGLFVTLAGQVRIGDYVKLDTGAEGYVIDFNWRSTRLQMPAGNVVVVPNSKFSQSVVTNFSLPSEDLAVSVDMMVDGASDLDKVERVSVEVARDVMTSVQGGVADFVPVVRFQGLTEGVVRFIVVLRAREIRDQSVVRHQFIKRIHARYETEGIVLPAPDYRARAGGSTPA